MQESDAVKKEVEVWLVFGWKIGQAALKKMIIDMPPDATEAGLNVIVSLNGQEAILGKVVASGSLANGMADLGLFLTEGDAVERLTRKIEEVGLGKLVSGEPRYWFAGG